MIETTIVPRNTPSVFNADIYDGHQWIQLPMRCRFVLYGRLIDSKFWLWMGNVGRLSDMEL